MQHTSSVDLHQPPALKAPQSSKIVEFVKEITITTRCIFCALAVFVLLTASLIPEDADAPALAEVAAIGPVAEATAAAL